VTRIIDPFWRGLVSRTYMIPATGSDYKFETTVAASWARRE
jgi:hypothetical protein